VAETIYLTSKCNGDLLFSDLTMKTTTYTE